MLDQLCSKHCTELLSSLLQCRRQEMPLLVLISILDGFGAQVCSLDRLLVRIAEEYVANHASDDVVHLLWSDIEPLCASLSRWRLKFIEVSL